MPDSYDIIIVGGGPSGAIATLYAKRAGLSVCLVDKETFPRDKICGDALSGKAVTILRELDLFKAVGDGHRCLSGGDAGDNGAGGCPPDG